MKKWMTLLLCCVLALNLTACGAGAPGGPEDNAPPQASALHFEVATQVYENEYKADDGTVLLAERYELPVFEMVTEYCEIYTLAENVMANGGTGTPAQFTAQNAFNTEMNNVLAGLESEAAQMAAEAKELYAENGTSVFLNGSYWTNELRLAQTYMPEGKLLSIAAENYTYYGGVHPNSATRAWSFDLTTGEFLTLDALASEEGNLQGNSLQESIYWNIYEQIAQKGLSEGYFDDYDSYLQDFPTLATLNFTENGLTVTFDQYVIAPYAAGPQVFSVPYSEFYNALSEHAKTILSVSQEQTVLADFDTAITLWAWFFMNTPPIGDAPDETEINGYTYYSAAIPGVSTLEDMHDLMYSYFDKALAGEIKFKTPNFDLLIEACRTTSVALFPNFMFLDAPFNRHEKWRIDDPDRFRYEVATMGCRTRVFENLHGEKSSWGRGNLSFTSMNLPRLAIEAMREAGDMIPDGNKHAIRKEAREIFLESVRKTATMMAEQLYERYCFQRTALARQFPFMMSNDVWKGGGRLQPNDEVGDVLKHGTLGIGFIGGHNAMVAIYGEGHATSKEAWQTLYDAVTVMNRVVEEYKAKYGLNYSVLATPAEGLRGRFTRMDRKRYGEIPGVTDRDYYVNSFHVDVREPVSIVEKIRLEAPFHAITRGGHITYVELDGEARKNPVAILKIVKVMQDEGIGYGSINHPIDTCRKCGHRGVIYSKCPVCGSDDILRMRRITGYLTGSLESWNSAKQAEERDRVKHR